MEKEGKGQREEAGKIFLQAWEEATNAFEKFLAAFYAARTRENPTDKLVWLEKSLENARNANSELAGSAFYNLYLSIAICYEELGEAEKAKEYYELSNSANSEPSDKGPFYHGTRADLQVGDLLSPGNRSNYKADLIMNHIYFTASSNGAGLAAALANGEGRQRVYIVEPTGPFENDPNVTDKKFPGNPTRSYRTSEPLKIVGELRDWVKLSEEEIQKWKDRLANNKGEIIN
jgi:tetratricopeptide (TPR) repeat protein